MLNKPVIFINFKTYEQATSENALALALSAESVSISENVSIAVVPQAIDLRMVAEKVSIPVFSQHLDPVSFGSNTGHILPEAVKFAGAVGAVLNHAENKKDNSFVQSAIQRAKEAGLEVMVCAESVDRAIELASMNPAPGLIAVEPPELIGGEVSVSNAKPELITETVEKVKLVNSSIDVVTGAGIKDMADVKKALELGTVGVFVASGIVKSENPKDSILDLARGLK